MTSRLYKICITGGICSGKSTITKFLGSQPHSSYLNLDSFTEVIYRRNPFVLNSIKAKLSGTVTEAEIQRVLPTNKLTDDFETKELFNRKELGKLCFSNRSILEIVRTAMLNEIIELERLSLMKLSFNNRDKSINERIKYVFIEAPTVIESGNQCRYDELWSIITKKTIIEERFRKRLKDQGIKEYDPAMLNKIIESQASNEDRIKHSKVVIDTNDELSVNLEKARVQFNDLLKRFT